MNDHLYIYFIRCSETGRVYVGRTRRPEHRWHQHLIELRGNRHYIGLMQNDFNSFGEESFKFAVLEKVKFSERSREKEFMKFFDSYNPNKGYNYLDVTIGDKRQREEKLKDISRKYGIDISKLEPPKMSLSEFCEYYTKSPDSIKQAINALCNEFDCET